MDRIAGFTGLTGFLLLNLVNPVILTALLAVEPFHAPAEGTGSIAVRLYPTENVATGSATLVTFGIPFTRGSLTQAQLATVRVLEGGTEVSAFVEQLTPWRHATNAAIDGASVRVARIQIRHTFAAGFPSFETVTVEWGARNRTRNIASLTNPRSAWHLVTTGSFAAANNVFEPDVYAVLPKEHLANGALRSARMEPFDVGVAEGRDDPEVLDATEHYDGFVELDRASKNNLLTVVNEDDPRVTDEFDCPYKTDFEPWLYDRGAAMFVVAMRSGTLKPLREAVRNTQFYKDRLYPAGTNPENAVGLFRLKDPDPFGSGGGNSAMYCYAESLAYDYWLTGDDGVVEAIPWVVSAHETNDEPTRWSPSLPGWTERHTAFRLLANTVAYEVLGDAVYRDRMLSQSADFVWHQNGADGQLPANRVDGGLYHFGGQHGDGEDDELVASTWMTAITVDAMVRAYAFTEDPEIAAFIRRAGRWEATVLKNDTDHLYDTFDGPLVYPAYMVRADGEPDRLDGGEGDVIDHSLEVAAAVAWGGYFADLTGAPDPALAEAATDLYFSYDIGVNYWTRPAAPPVGLPAFRVSPWRKFGWEHRPSGSFSWVMGQLGGGTGVHCDTAGAGTVRNIPVGALAGTFDVDVTITPGAAGMNGTIGLASGAQTKLNGLACAVRFGPSGTIDPRNAKKFVAGTVAYQASTPYLLRFRIDLATHTYSAFVVGDGGAETPIGTGLAFPKKLRRLTSLDTVVLVVGTGALEACREE